MGPVQGAVNNWFAHKFGFVTFRANKTAFSNKKKVRNISPLLFTPFNLVNNLPSYSF